MREREVFGVGFHRRGGTQELEPWLGLPSERVRALVVALRSAGMAEGMVLSTCERLEIYGVGPVEAAVAFLGSLVPAHSLKVWIHREAVRHLFRVAVGLDSTAVGESEILGQVREALAIAREAGAIGPILGPLVERALALGRAVRAQTGLGQTALSLATLAVRALRHQVVLEGKSVLVAGAGTIGAQIAQAVRRQGPARLWVISRRWERARALADAVGGEAGTLEDLASLLAQVDVAFMALAAPQSVLSAPLLEAIMVARSGAPLWLVDLGAPPNVDANGVSLPGLHLIRLEDLQALSQPHRERIAEIVARAEAMVEAAVREWERWCQARSAGPWIAQLQRRAEAIRQQELAWLWPKLGDLSPAQRARIEQFAHRLVQKLLHPQILALKAIAQDPEWGPHLAALWGLDPEMGKIPISAGDGVDESSGMERAG